MLAGWERPAGFRSVPCGTSAFDQSVWPVRSTNAEDCQSGFGATRAIYAAFGAGWPDPGGLNAWRQGLVEEAVWLGHVVVGLLPEEPEGPRSARPDALCRRAAGRTAQCQGPLRAAVRAGPRLVECRSDRRGRT